VAEPIFTQVQAIAPDLLLLIGDNHYGNRPDYDNLVFHLLRERSVPSQAAVLARTPTLGRSGRCFPSLSQKRGG
jgi:hypothetical protein